MRITFAGVGEAFDENLVNTSVLVEDNTTSILLDCGFTAASAFWRTASSPLSLDGLYITHFHGDHYFGVPALLVRSVEERRTKPLTIMGQPGVAGQIRQLMDLAYPNTLSKAQFDINFLVCEPGNKVGLNDMMFSFALNDHSMPSQSIRIDSGGKSVFYSGDGRPTPETQALAHECDLVIHESFSLDPDTPGHGTVDSSIKFAHEAGAGQLALVHVQRMVRRKQWLEITAKMEKEKDVNVCLPEPGDTIIL